MRVDNKEALLAITRTRGIAPSLDTIMRSIDSVKEGEKMQSDEEIREKIRTFFDDHIEIVIDSETGQQQITWLQAPTKSLFAVHMGWTLRTLDNYLSESYASGYRGNTSGKISPEAVKMVQQAVALMASYYEGKLGTATFAGSIFWLKNLRQGNWRDDTSLRIESENQIPMQSRPVLTAMEIMERHKGAELPEMPDLD